MVTTIEIVSSQIRPGEVVFGGLILDSRRFETELAVDDGQTIVIGGIMRTEEAETVHRVPILGYIPILSLIFSKTDSQNIQTELIAFITPTVLTNRKSADDVTTKQRQKLEELQRWMKERNGKDSTEEE